MEDFLERRLFPLPSAALIPNGPLFEHDHNLRERHNSCKQLTILHASDYVLTLQVLFMATLIVSPGD